MCMGLECLLHAAFIDVCTFIMSSVFTFVYYPINYLIFADRIFQNFVQFCLSLPCHEMIIYTVSQKNDHIFIFLITGSNVNRF